MSGKYKCEETKLWLAAEENWVAACPNSLRIQISKLELELCQKISVEQSVYVDFFSVTIVYLAL